jgi:VWFA-related protein
VGTSRWATSSQLALCVLAISAANLFLAGARAQTSLPPSPPVNLPPPPGSPQAAPQQHSLKSEVELVALHVTVADTRGEFVSDLRSGNFKVFENKIEQKISLFSRDDIPVTMGLVVDNSASMRTKRAQVNAAAMSFVRTSNPQDEAFVVNFNDEYYLDTEGDFTNDQKNMNDALAHIDTRGSTALYDALIGSLDHLKKGHKDKRVLLVVTDGVDNASRQSFESTIKIAEQSNAAIYAIGVFSDEDRRTEKSDVRKARKDLKALAEATGGEAFFPATLDEVTPICERVAKEIRNQYTLGYYPTNAAKDGSFREVKVEVIPPSGYDRLSVRTRVGYYAPKAAAAD